MEGLSQESYLYYKLQDIRKVLEGFEEYLRDLLYYQRRDVGCTGESGM